MDKQKPIVNTSDALSLMAKADLVAIELRNAILSEAVAQV